MLDDIWITIEKKINPFLVIDTKQFFTILLA